MAAFINKSSERCVLLVFGLFSNLDNITNEQMPFSLYNIIPAYIHCLHYGI